MREITLMDGNKIPILGFGVYQIPKEETEKSVIAAIEAGYRHIDTAQAYLNEVEVGEAIKHCGVPRKELFITTKVWVENVSYDKARQSILASLKRMQLDYLDLVLIHQPYNDVYGAWRAMCELKKEGKIRSIGVSNFNYDKLVDLGVFTDEMPAVNQIELNPFHQQKEKVEILKEENVALEAWAPFAEGRNNIFSNPVLDKIAKKHNKSVAQVIIRYFVEQNIVVLAKSTKQERMKENLNVFDFTLDLTDKEEIAALDLKESQFVDHASPERIRQMAKHKLNLG
ncbi:aldo/keto reductase [Gemella morbillorum]|jgi:aldo/keto reductase family oxidoreductase|uniref:aldo/keto reductase n=1 Tax=Gemella morbillorum TaxID=29391 RepID=UPI0028D23835|nr:aldo/keto reductase [Gemella morbillorum]